MSMRRQRIKASANLMNSKARKPKISSDIVSTKIGVIDDECQIEKIDQIVKSSAELKNGAENDVDNSDLAYHITTEDPLTALSPIPADNPQKNGNDEFFHLPADTKVIGGTNIVAHNNDQTTKGKVTLQAKQLEYSKKKSQEIIVPNKPKLESSFKCPPNVSYQRSNSCSTVGLVHGNEDAFQTDLEESVIQMDLLKSNNSIHQYPMSPMSPMSPSKSVARQRIRVTPVFGQRRNSFVGSSPSHTAAESEAGGGDFIAPPVHRRERHFSGSLSLSSNATSLANIHHYHTPHKYVPTMGRIRTESGCSVFSDSYAPSSKSRKTDQDQHHRALSRRDFEARFNNGHVPDKSSLKMFDLIYYNPITNPMEQKSNIGKLKQEDNGNAEDVKTQNKEDITTNASIKPENDRLPVPQLKLNSAGELILDDKSLEIETTAEQEARKVLANSSLIFLDENTGMNGFYRRQKRTKEWPPEETIKFYRCLQTVGTDFSLMEQLFPNRTRRDLKLKFKKEERCNLALINKALLYPKIFNIDELKVQLEAEDREREEAERKWKEIKAQDAKAVKRVQGEASAAQRAIAPTDIFYLNENITKSKLSKRAKKNKPNTINNNNNTNNIDNSNNNNNNKNMFPDNNNATIIISDEKQPKEKRRRLKKQKAKIGTDILPLPNSFENVKYEIIEMENNYQHQMGATGGSFDSIQLESELPEFFQNNVVSHRLDTENLNDYNSCIVDDGTNSQQYKMIENKSLVNLDDGTVTYIHDDNNKEVDSAVRDTASIHTPTETLSIQAHDEDSQATCDMDESDIQQILTELSEGTMVLVSTLDPNNEDKVLNEIYMLDKVTGELCENPLDIPDAIVQCILNVMS